MTSTLLFVICAGSVVLSGGILGDGGLPLKKLVIELNRLDTVSPGFVLQRTSVLSAV
jgi:hypothetical protein